MSSPAPTDAPAIGCPEDPTAYPVLRDVRTRYGDLAPDGQIGIVALARWFEDARVAADLPAFRRLAGKTQVFTSRASDHFRSRLTHTIEVAQVARQVAGALGLNVDLAESLALVHDIGHPPFAHAGTVT